MKLSTLLFHIPVTFLHGGALLARHIKLQGGISGCRGQVQASSFVSTNETDSDSKALSWAPNHGLHCCRHHCGKVRVRDEATGGQDKGKTKGGGYFGDRMGS